MENFIKNIFLFFLVITLGLTNPTYKVNSIENVEWLLIKENKDGKEWLDTGSIKNYKNNEISVLTKYYENPSSSKKKGETNLYVMRINCSSREYKDISVNGLPNYRAKWKISNNDELIDVVIDKSCNVSNN
tara:strand:+ start:519 stop:911 length:393 start_codon:yes stop_codon:yes gene_type:complete